MVIVDQNRNRPGRLLARHLDHFPYAAFSAGSFLALGAIAGYYATIAVVTNLRNGFGVGGSGDTLAELPVPLVEQLARGELFTVSRDYLALGLTLEWTPLLDIEPLLISNLDDGSALVQVQAVRSLSEKRLSMSPISRPKLTFAVLIAIAAGMHAPILELHLWEAMIYFACLIATLAFGLRSATHMALLTSLVALIALVPALADSVGSMPVLPLLLPLLVSSLVVAALPATRKTLRWMRLGQVDTNAWTLVVLTGMASAGALIAWASWTNNLGVGESMMADVAHVSLLALVLLGIPAFAFLNALTEEAIFRGVFFTALLESSRSPGLANVVQAAAFAAIHYEMGFPNGPIGYAMVLLYGFVLGYLRFRTGGLLAPIAAHIVADLVIGLIMVGQAGVGCIP